MKIGEHTWVESPGGGGWCRHSNGSVCVPKLRVTKGPELTPDNVEDIIADLKSKRTVTPYEEKRLRAVAESKGGIWNLRGPPDASIGKGGVGLRGEVGHNLLGEDLPYAKIIDSAKIDPLTGMAKEVRSIKTHQLYNYQEPGAFLAQLKSEINELKSFKSVPSGSGGTLITATKNTERILVIGVPPRELEAAAGVALTEQWRKEAQEAIEYANKKGIKVIFKSIK